MNDFKPLKPVGNLRLSGSCHSDNLCQPLTTSNRLQFLCYRAFWQPDNLFSKKITAFTKYKLKKETKPTLTTYGKYKAVAVHNQTVETNQILKEVCEKGKPQLYKGIKYEKQWGASLCVPIKFMFFSVILKTDAYLAKILSICIIQP